MNTQFSPLTNALLDAGSCSDDDHAAAYRSIYKDWRSGLAQIEKEKQARLQKIRRDYLISLCCIFSVIPALVLGCWLWSLIAKLAWYRPSF